MPGEVLPDPSDAADWLARLERHRVDLLVLAGYLKLVPPEVVARYRGRILNVHPALLPAFGGRGMYGHRVHEAVLASGARETGATVHLVDEEYDRGAILAQARVPVLPGDTPSGSRPGCSRPSIACFPRWCSPPRPPAIRFPFP